MKRKIMSCMLVFVMILNLLQGILPENIKPIRHANAINFDSVNTAPFAKRNIRFGKLPLSSGNNIFTTISEGTFADTNHYYETSIFDIGRIADIVVRNENNGNPYTSTAMCLDMHALAVNSYTHTTQVGKYLDLSDGNNQKLIYQKEYFAKNVKPFLDFYYYTTHIIPNSIEENLTDEEKVYYKWTDQKRIAMGVLTQNVVWLYKNPTFLAKSEDERKNTIAVEMANAIAKINTLVDPDIQNGTKPYTKEECLKTIDYILNLNNHLNNEAMRRINGRFKYYVLNNTADGDGVTHNGERAYQRYILPAYDPTTEEYPVYIKIRKVSAKDTSNGLANATFSVTGDYVKPGTEIVSGSDGWAYSKAINVPIKTKDYTFNIREIIAPEGHFKDNNSYDIIANHTNNSTKDTAATTTPPFIKNTKIEYEPTEANIVKVDMHSGRKLDGAVFRMSGPGGTFNVQTMGDKPKFQCTDPTADNYIVPGTYTVEEITPPPGYDLDRTNPNAQTITFIKKEWPVGSGNYITETSGQLIFKNPKFTRVKLHKISATNKPLPGAKFEIMKDATVIGSEVTDGAGTITLRNVSSGTYTFTEIEAPHGYELPKDAKDRVHTIKVDTAEGRDEYTIYAVNHQKKRIILRKYAEDGTTLLPGAEFRIEKDGQFLTSKTTNGAGEIEIEHAGTGFYTFTEITAPDGYMLPLPSERVLGIYIDAEDTNEVYYLSAINYKYPEIRLRKLSADDDPQKPLKNALFKCYIEGKAFGEFFTDSNGEINIKYNDSVDADGRPVKGYGRFLNDINHPLQHEWQVRFEEITPPDGYLLAEPSWQENTIVKGQVLSDFAFTNSKYPEIVILKQDSSTSKPLAGTVFNVMIDGQSLPGTWVTDDKGIIRINYQNYHRFLGDLGNPNRSWTVTVTEVTPPAHYFNAGILTPKVQTGELRLGHRLTTFTFKNEPHPDLIVYKKSSKKDAALPGVTYELVAENKAHKRKATTNAFGEAKFENVAEGTYTLREIDAPNGIILSEKTYTIVSEPSLDGHKQTLEVFFSNDDTPTLRIKKIDEVTGKPIENVKFNITYKADKLAGTETDYGDFFTNADGEIFFDVTKNLKTGWYTITEVAPPDGYTYHKIDGKSKTIYLEGNREYVHTVRNVPMTSMQVIKIDKDTEAPLKDAKFIVRRINNELIGEFTTNSDGIFIVPNLEPGWYTVKETEAPIGYNKVEDERKFEVTQGQFIKLVFENPRKPGLQILKVDETTREPIAGTEFSVTKSNGENLLQKYTTDKDGLITINDLSEGTYIVTETKAAHGYIKSDEKHTVVVKKTGITTLEVTNKKASGFLIHKIDSVTKEPLSGAVFLLSEKATGKTIGQYTSDNKGNVYVSDIKAGTYSIKEITAPDSYMLDQSEKTLKIADGKFTTITWENTAKLGQIQVFKKSKAYSEQTGLEEDSPLAGAVFNIYNYKGDKLIGQMTTNSEGLAVSKPLPLGQYKVREIIAPKHYQLSNEDLIFTLEYENQIIKKDFYNKPANLSLNIDKIGVVQTMPGKPHNYIIKNVANTSNTALENFYIRDVLPTKYIKAEGIMTGTYSSVQKYDVFVKTSFGKKIQVAGNLNTDKNNYINLLNFSNKLRKNEFISEITLVFGKVPAGFRQKDDLKIAVKTHSWLKKQECFYNTADVGGTYMNEWIVQDDKWKTCIWLSSFNNTTNEHSLPITGF